jgi:hypothetical protein
MAGAYKYRPQYTQNTIGPSAGEETEVTHPDHDGPCYEEGVLEGLEYAAKLVDRFKETELDLSPLAQQIRLLKQHVKASPS